MKKTLLIVLILAFTGSLIYISTNEFNFAQKVKDLLKLEIDTETEPEKDSENYIGVYKSYKNEGIQLAIFPKNLEFSTYKQVPNQKDFQLKQDLSNVIDQGYLFGMNSSFFTADYDHIGLLVTSGEVLSQLSVNNPQATHVLELSPSTQVFTTSEFNLLPNDYIGQSSMLLQTGPLIISEGTIETEYIQNSLNGNSEHFRSIIGFTEDKVFFLATRKQYSLIELSEIIVNLSEFEGEKVTAINLDGGSSVSYYSSENPSFGFGENKKLPYYILVKN